MIVCNVGAARILVVEDEPLSRMAIDDLLRTSGFDVVSVATDHAAYAELRQTQFDALVLDINLGEGTTGFDVSRFARTRDPVVKVVYVSGGSPDWLTAFGVTGSEFIAKPFDGRDLIEILRRMVGYGSDDNGKCHMPSPA